MNKNASQEFFYFRSVMYKFHFLCLYVTRASWTPSKL